MFLTLRCFLIAGTVNDSSCSSNKSIGDADMHVQCNRRRCEQINKIKSRANYEFMILYTI